MKNHQVGQQQEFGLFPIAELEVNGLPMGVLSDGTPYLTMRGLSRVCGIDASTLAKLATNWDEERTKPRGIRLLSLMHDQGHSGDNLYIVTQGSQGEVHAYSDAVCMAFLEYYAFEAETKNKETAVTNYRILARSSFKTYIYKQCGYDPEHSKRQSWQHYIDRVSLNDKIPISFFSVFREMSSIIVNLINSGCMIDDKTVPDISVGMIWGKHWKELNYDQKFGERIKFPHEYPPDFRQNAASSIEPWIYPMTALGEFRVWLYDSYVKENFGGYLQRKVSQGALPNNQAALLLTSLQQHTTPE